MGQRSQKNNKKHVLSFRVDEKDWELLQKTSSKAGVDISTLLRESLHEALRASPES
jgi:predicted DNA binding CopG/RHH family protein